MKAEDLKTKTADELTALLMETRKAQMNMRFQRSQGALEKTDEIRKTRRSIARIKTLQTAQRKGLPTDAVKKPPKKSSAGAEGGGAGSGKPKVEKTKTAKSKKSTENAA
jgi:large subunit ribosomal protein L29